MFCGRCDPEGQLGPFWHTTAVCCGDTRVSRGRQLSAADKVPPRGRHLGVNIVVDNAGVPVTPPHIVRGVWGAFK